MAAPTGTVTFLFTDIEGSTKLLHALGDGYAELLDDHHRLMREVFLSDGFEVGTEGDAFFVAFQSATDAARAAAAAQRRLAAHRWPGGVEVRVRMGLHSGEAKQVGDNYGGIDVHRAARIAGAAHGGQVICSDATRGLIHGSLGDDITLLDLGTHRLKDLERPEHLFQLCIAGLPVEFPPLRTLDARPTNLPDFLGPFVRRDREVAEIELLVSDRRLVTLTGPGGTGKTRLALKVAADLLDRFPDGVFLVPLAPVSDVTLVAPRIAQVLGVMEHGMQPIEERLRDFLADKHMLLVLDNFEQIIAAGPVVSELLSAAPKIHLVVTSRAPIRIYGEQEYPVPPMVVPDPGRGASFEELAAAESVELFAQRARSVDPRFELTPENAAVVAAICARVDGLPLAIELAASRVKLFTPADILKRLEKSLSLLSGGARDLPSRQQTLRGAIAWSYDLLGESSRAFFVRLGIFVGGCSLEAAERVVADDLEATALTELETLVDNNLVRLVAGESGETRFRMLQTIREFALEVLEKGADLEHVEERHALFFLKIAEQGESEFTKDQRWGDLLTDEHDNLRAALRWALRRNRTDIGLLIASALWRFWQVRGHLAEGRTWLTELLAAHPAPDGNRAKGLTALGSVTYWQNDFESCAAHYRESLEIYRALDDRVAMAGALYNWAFVALVARRLDEARERYEESASLYRELGDDHGLANATWGLAMAALLGEDGAQARALAEVAARLYAEQGDWFGESLTDSVFSQVAKLEGDLARAREIMLKQVDGAESSGDLTALASLCDMVADIDLLEGNAVRGLVLAGAGESLRQKAGGGAPPPLTLISADPRELARRYLTEHEIERAWNEGLAMSPAEVIGYVKKDPEADGS